MWALHDVSIRNKLAAGYGLALFLILIVGAIGIGQTVSNNRFANEFVRHWLPEIQLLGEIQRAATEHRLQASRLLETRDFHQQADLSASLASTSARVKIAKRTYASLMDTDEEAALIQDFGYLWTAYEESVASAIEKLGIGDAEEGVAEFNTHSLFAFELAARKIDGLQEVGRQEGVEALGRAQDMQRRFLALTIGVLILAAAVVGAAIFWIGRNVSVPILRVSEAMRRLTAGDEAIIVPEARGRQDEIGTLIGAVAAYRETLDQRRRLAEEKDLEHQRFEAAARNMSIGVCMFSADMRLVFSNDRYAEMYGLPPELTKPGTPWRDIVRYRIGVGLYVGQDPEKYLEHLSATINRGERLVDLVELRDGRVINLVHQPIPEGGWVATHDDITEVRRNEARIKHMARHDSLTDLPNRLLLSEHITKALAQKSGRSLAIVSLNLDRVKAVNDALGPAIGDGLLQEVARRLVACAGGGDTVARLGGDEFAVVQMEGEQPLAATLLSQTIIDSLATPYSIDGHQIVIGASLGIALSPTDGFDADQLLRNSAMAVTRAKADGRGVYRFFERAMDARMQARHQLELEMRNALPGGQLELHYQPIVKLETGKISGCEALLRWRHPDKGLMVAPGDFIPLAEEIGLIVPIGEWVIRQACIEAARWPEPLKVAVNLSPIQFRSERLLPTVVEALAASGLPPTRLELEITESVLISDTELALTTLHRLRALGVRIAMDDFGTGYSSLSYLRSFPFDKIKIDQSFIRDLSEKESSFAIIRAVTSISRTLGIITTAEGVETEGQLSRLAAEGCTEAQGFLFSRPLPAKDVAQMIGAVRQRVSAAA